MKKQVISAALAATLLLCSCGQSTTSKPEAPSDVPATSESAASSDSTSNEPVSTNNPVTTHVLKDGDLQPITVAEPNNIETNGYLEQQNGNGDLSAENLAKDFDTYFEPYVDENGKQLVLDTGHRVYVLKDLWSTNTESDDSSDSQSSDESSTEEQTQQEVQLRVISGHTPIPYENGQIDYSRIVILRAQDTCERIQIFDSAEKMETAKTMFQMGNAILAGEAEYEDNTVIVNGSYVPDLHYTVADDGTISISLADLAKACGSDSEYYDMEGVLFVSMDTLTWYIPTVNALPYTDYLSSFQLNEEDKTWHYDSTVLPMWSDTFALPEDETVTMPIEDISRIFGWEFSTADGLLSVVTDELDCCANYVLHPTNTETETYTITTSSESSEDSDASSTTKSDTSLTD